MWLVLKNLRKKNKIRLFFICSDNELNQYDAEMSRKIALSYISSIKFVSFFFFF